MMILLVKLHIFIITRSILNPSGVCVRDATHMAIDLRGGGDCASFSLSLIIQGARSSADYEV